jgi:hypothetical protein
MNKLLAILKSLWPKLPQDLRYAMLAMCAVLITTFAILAWRDGYRPVGMERYLTRDVSQNQIDTLRSHLEEGRSAAIMDALQQYDGSIKDYLAHERMLGMDTLVRPAIKMLFDLDQRVRKIERGLKLTNEKVDQMPTAYEERLRKLIEDNNSKDQTALLLQEVLKRLEAQDAANLEMKDAIEELRPMKRVSKGKF